MQTAGGIPSFLSRLFIHVDKGNEEEEQRKYSKQKGKEKKTTKKDERREAIKINLKCS